MEKNKSKKAFYQHRTLIFMQIKIDEKLQKKNNRNRHWNQTQINGKKS